MKIVSFNTITKSLREMTSLSMVDYNNLYGRGSSGSLVIDKESYGTNQVVLTDISRKIVGVDSTPNLEFENLTIGEDTDVLGNNLSTPLYLKVNGTLTVNGHLHMDRQGGKVSQSGTILSKNGVRYIQSNTSLNYALVDTLNLSDSESCPDSLYNYLNLYGNSNTFFDGNIALTGAGGVGYVWEERVETHTELVLVGYTQNLFDYNRKPIYNEVVVNTPIAEPVGYESVSSLDGGGNFLLLPRPEKQGDKTFGGSGGGFLSIYYENYLNNAENWFIDTVGTYPLNIHANGGSSISTAKDYFRGGGCMIIAARSIVIGPKGSITCDGGDGNGMMALLSRAPYQEQFLFNNGNPIKFENQFTGGAGFALGYLK